MSADATVVPNIAANRSILLVDVHTRTRDSRAKTMRKLGATVDAVSNAVAAVAQFATRQYRLVLIDMGIDVQGAEQLAHEIRSKDPKQQVAFLVGGSKLISKTLARKAPVEIPAAREFVAERQPEELRAEAANETDFGRRVREVEERG